MPAPKKRRLEIRQKQKQKKKRWLQKRRGAIEEITRTNREIRELAARVSEEIARYAVVEKTRPTPQELNELNRKIREAKILLNRLHTEILSDAYKKNLIGEKGWSLIHASGNYIASLMQHIKLLKEKFPGIKIEEP